MIEIWMKSHLVSDSNLQKCKSIIPPKRLQEFSINVGLTFSVGDIRQWFTILVLSKKIRVGDTRYHI